MAKRTKINFFMTLDGITWLRKDQLEDLIRNDLKGPLYRTKKDWIKALKKEISKCKTKT